MKFERIAYTAVAVLLATACTGGDEQASVDPAPVVDVAATAAPITTTTVAPTTTAAPVATTQAAAPASLAFASTRDIGRLFEVDGEQNLQMVAGGEIVGVIADGTLVQATSARSNDGELWVRVSDAQGEILGWIAASRLRPTEKSIASFDQDDVGQLRQVRAAVAGDEIALVSQPGASGATGALQENEIGMHGGNSVLAADGEVWIDVVDPGTRSTIGWVVGSDFPALTRNQVRSGDNNDISRRENAEVTYGASLPTGQVSAAGCNASQISFENSDSSRGLALVFGLDAPIGRQSQDSVVWAARGGSKVYIEPGDTAVFTLLTSSTQTWHFAALDAAGQTATTGDTTESGELIASNVQSFLLNASSCGFVEQAQDSSTDSVPPTDTSTEVEDPTLSGEADPEEESSETAPTVTEGDTTSPDAETPTTTQAPSADATESPDTSEG